MAVPLVYDYRGIAPYKRDEDFLFKALSYKQSQLDTNRGKLQNLYDQYSMLGAIKGVDKEYINGRLQEVTDIVDQYTSGDLSSDYLTQNLMSNLDQMVDQKVINAVSSKKLREKEVQEWEDARLEGGEKYAKLNEEWALNKNPNWKSYVNNDQVGAVYNGGSEFTEFVDVHKAINDNALKIAKFLEESYVKVSQDQFGNFVDETGKKVNRQKLRAALDATLGPKEKKQLEINGWGQYGQLSDQQLEQQFNEFNSAKVRGFQQELAKMDNFMKTSEYQSATAEEKAEIKDASDHYRQEIEKVTSGSLYQEATANGRDFVETYMYTNRLMNDVLNGYEFNEVTSYDVNKSFKYYNDNKREDEKIAREALEKQEAARAKKAEKEEEETAKGGTSGPTMGSATEVEGYDKSVEGALAQKQKYAQDARNEFNSTIGSGNYSKEQQEQIRDFTMRSSTGQVSSAVAIDYKGADGKSYKIVIGDKERAAMYKYKQVLAGQTAADAIIQKSADEADKAITQIMTDALDPKNLKKWNDYATLIPVPQGEYYGEVTKAGSPKGKIARLAVLISDPSLSKEQRKEYYNIYERLLRETGAKPVQIKVKQQITSGNSRRDGTTAIQSKVVTVDNNFVNNFGNSGITTGLSKINSAQWEVNDNGNVFSSDRAVSKNTPASTIKTILANVDRDIETAVTKGNVFPAPRPMTFGAKTKEGEILRRRVIADLPKGALGLDLNQPITVVPVYDIKDKKAVKGYTIEYFGTGDEKGKQVSAEITAADMAKILPLAITSAPLINANVPGQSFELGTPKDYVTKGRSGVNKSPQAVANINGVKAYAQVLKNNLQTQSDKDKIDVLYSNFYEGRLKFEIATVPEAGIVVNIRQGNNILHTTYGLIQSGAIQAEELVDIDKLTGLQNKAFYEYLSVFADDLETTKMLRGNEDAQRGKLN